MNRLVGFSTERQKNMYSGLASADIIKTANFPILSISRDEPSFPSLLKSPGSIHILSVR